MWRCITLVEMGGQDPKVGLDHLIYRPMRRLRGAVTAAATPIVPVGGLIIPREPINARSSSLVACMLPGRELECGLLPIYHFCGGIRPAAARAKAA